MEKTKQLSEFFLLCSTDLPHEGYYIFPLNLTTEQYSDFRFKTVLLVFASYGGVILELSCCVMVEGNCLLAVCVGPSLLRASNAAQLRGARTPHLLKGPIVCWHACVRDKQIKNWMHIRFHNTITYLCTLFYM